MDVFLVPVAPAPPGGEPRFELYCEPRPDSDEVAAGTAGAASQGSVMSRLVGSFQQALAEGEAEERRHEDGLPSQEVGNGGSRVSRLVKRKLAAAVAEQRLLWRLRQTSAATLHHPATVSSERALSLVMTEFKRDLEKHRLWCGIDAGLVVASAPLMFVPGPNFVAYYFIFRSVGHFFSFRGARKGMAFGLWTPQPSQALADLEQALSLEPTARAERIAAVAADLHLDRLPVFLRRVADRPRPT